MGIQLANRKIGRVGEVHNHHIKHIGLRFKPLERILIHNAHFRRQQCTAVEFDECWLA